MSQLTRGIFGRKPTTSGSSDVFSLTNQYSASTTGTWPSSSSSTGLVMGEDFASGDIGIGTYTKLSNGLYYPETFIDYAPASNYIAQGDSNSQFGAVGGLSVSKGGTHIAVIVTTRINQTVQNLFIWKKPAAGYAARWQYLTVLTNVDSFNYVNAVEFHPSGNYLVYGTYGTSSQADIVLYSRSGDTFTYVSTTTSSASSVYAMAWNPDGTTLAVGISVSPYIKFYNFSGGTFTALSNPSTLPANTVTSIAWNHNGTSVALQVNNTATPLVIYNRSGNTFSTIGGITGQFRGTGGNPGGMSWNNTGTLLAMTDYGAVVNGGTVGTMAVWSRSGDSFSPVSIPTPLLSGITHYQAQFSPNGSELVVAQGNSIDIWTVNGTSITRGSVSPFGGYTGRITGNVYGARMGTTYGNGDTYTIQSPNRWIRWIPPA